jgi:hypothetical protein
MSEPTNRSRSGPVFKLVLGLCLALSLLAGCTPAAPARDFPSAKAIPGWKAQDIQTYTPADLGSLVGQTTAVYKAYAFDRVDVQTFLGPKDLKITVQIFRLPDSAMAYGLWTHLRKDKPVKIGVDGASDGISELSFWQDRYFVRLLANQAATPAQLEGLAKNASAALPKDGNRPSLGDRAPTQNLSKDGLIYFRDESAIQAQLDLGGKNLLGLNEKTGAVLAFYTLDGQPANLLLVEYPDEQSTQDALVALQNSGLPDLLVSGSRGVLLGAVIGKTSAESASTLLGEALK